MPTILDRREYRRIETEALETRTAEDGAMIVEGYATTYNQPYTLFRETGIYRKMIRMLNSQVCTAMEQDAFNVFCQGQIKKIGPEWNMAEHITEHHDDPYITHYAGCLKPRGEQVFDEYRKAEWRVKNADED